MLYFLLHDAATFHGRIAPALAAGWRRRTFAPVAALAAELAPALAAFADRFRLTADERPLLAGLAADRPFDRRLWRHLAGEVLLYAAADVPTVQTARDTLAALLTADPDPIRQAHFGSRDLEFDGVPYRSGSVGINDRVDVARLAIELTAVDTSPWTVAELADHDNPEEELAFALECLAALREMYSQARARDQVVICEEI